jgi:hypothetical protein
VAAPCSQWIARSPVRKRIVAGRSTRSLDRMETHRLNSANSWVLCALFLLAAGFTVALIVTLSGGSDVSRRSERVWFLSFSILVTLWAYNDRNNHRGQEPRDYPYFLMFLFWPVVLLYHLMRSRHLKGLAIYLAFLATYLAPYLASYVYFATYKHAI